MCWAERTPMRLCTKLTVISLKCWAFEIVIYLARFLILIDWPTGLVLQFVCDRVRKVYQPETEMQNGRAKTQKEIL